MILPGRPSAYRSLMAGLQKGVRSRQVLARKLSRRPGLYCIRLSRVLASAVSSGKLRLARLARDRLRWDQACSGGLSSRAYGGRLADGQPVPGGDELGQGPADVGIEVARRPPFSYHSLRWPRG
jgi:hypothetical protein